MVKWRWATISDLPSYDIFVPRKVLRFKIFDDVIACDLWFGPLNQNVWLCQKVEECLKNFLKTFFLENTCGCVLGPWPWPRAFLSLASKGSVLGKAVLGLGLGFFLCPWPWPQALCSRLHLCFLVHSATFCSYRCLGCLRLLIAIFGLEVCDVIIMSKFVYCKLVYFFYCDVHGLFWDIR